MMKPALNVRQAAELAGVSTKTIYRELDRGALMAYRVGRAVRIDRDDFDHWFRSEKWEAPKHEGVSHLSDRRPRRLPTTDAARSVERMRDLDQQDEAA